MDTNPGLAAARQEIGIADGVGKQAGFIPIPEISHEMKDTGSNTSTTTVIHTQTLELGGNRGARVEVATYGHALRQLMRAH